MRPFIAGDWKMHGLTPHLDEIRTVVASVAAMPSHADVNTMIGLNLTESDFTFRPPFWRAKSPGWLGTKPWIRTTSACHVQAASPGPDRP